MKKIFLLFLSAFLSFLFLSYIDEYENLLAPFLKKTDESADPLRDREATDKEAVRDFLMKFNKSLSEIYISANPERVSELPASDELKNSVAGEIALLKNKGQIMDVVTRELRVIKMDRMSVMVRQVQVKEKSGVRYAAVGNGGSSAPYSENESTVVYTLIAGAEGMTVAAFEVRSADGN